MIDTHVHLYDPGVLHYDWVAGLGDLDRPHLIEDYSVAASAGDVSGIVFVEVDCRAGEGLPEARWVAAQHANTPTILGIVAFAPVESDDLSGYLDQLAEVPLVCGTRRLLQHEPEGFTSDVALRRGLGQIGARGLTFDICCTSAQLGAVAEMVSSRPDVGFVLDHVGNPDIQGGEWDPWATRIRQVAELDNVLAVKLSGLFSKGPPAGAGRYLEHVIEAFGPSRLMVGSDWPVCNQTGSHAEWIAVVDDAIAGLSPSEQDDVRDATATRVYRLRP